MQGPQLDAEQALARLRAGNLRFVDHVVSLEALLSHARRDEHARAQRPFAVVLGCSDSRAPAEFVFDQGLGDLFVIRVAGNIVAPSQIGSVEFAVGRYGVQLVVVMGHSRCGAILASLDELTQPGGQQSRGLRDILDRVRPAVESFLDTDLRHDHEALVRGAVRANVRIAASHLRHGSALLEKLVDDGKLLIVGAEYSLETGVVEFFDGVPG